MQDDANRKNVVEESEVASPMALVASTLGLSQELLEDAGFLLPFLDEVNLDRALYLLDCVHGLGYLTQLGEAELEGLGLSESERLRLQALTPIASRMLCERSKVADPATRRELANEITFRGMAWSQVTAGVVAWNAAGQRVADRIVAIGTTEGIHLDLTQVLRLALCAPGTVTLVLWVWQPLTRIRVTAQDRALADELRTMSAALRIGIEDVLLVGQGDSVSLAVLDQWQ